MKQYLSELSVFFSLDFSVDLTERAILSIGVLWLVLVFTAMATIHRLTT